MEINVERRWAAQAAQEQWGWVNPSGIGLGGEALEPLLDLAGAPADTSPAENNRLRKISVPHTAVDRRTAFVSGQA